MQPDDVLILRSRLTGDGPLDTATSRATLRAVSRGELNDTFEVGVSHPVVAFGKHDTSARHFADAVRTASTHGFEPTVRIAGGRAAVFHEATIRFGYTHAVPDSAVGMHDRFRWMSGLIVETIGAWGIHAEIGEIPGEYCPGEYSVHIGRKKVMGLGQRLTKGAAHIGGVIVLDGVDRINEVLQPIYEQLQIPMDPSATGSLRDAMPIDANAFMDRFTELVVGDRNTVDGDLPPAVRKEAQTYRSDHDPTT